MILQQKNKHPRDDAIWFDEEPHLYYVNGEKYTNSVTKFVHHFFPHFDQDKVIDNMMSGKNWSKSPYFGMTKKEIKEQWKKNGQEASSMGTHLHKSIELYYNQETVDNDSPEYQYFLNFDQAHVQGKMEPYRTEWEVYDEDIKLAGSIDKVYKLISDDGSEKYVIYDWKRSKGIKETNNFESAYPPIEHLPNCNKWQYSLQLNTYKYMLEKNYGIEIEGMYLVILHPNNKSYIRMSVPNMQEEVVSLLYNYNLSMNNKKNKLEN